MKLSKIAFAVASTLAIASGAAFAGQIGSSSITIATEVIYADSQIVRAPSNVYSFAGDINAQNNTQRLQLQYTLTKGTWNVGTDQLFKAANTLVTLSNSVNSGSDPKVTGTAAAGSGLDEIIKINYNNALNTGKSAFPVGSTGSAFVTSDLKTLVFNVTIPGTAGDDYLLRSPAFTINAPAFTTGTKSNAGVNGLFSVAGVTACPAPDQNIDISFKHFSTHNGNTDLISNASADSEHLRANSTNSARLLNFVQNHIFTVTPATSNSRQDAATLNQKLSGANFAAVTTGTNTNPVNFLSADFVTKKTGFAHYLGKVVLSQRAQGVDTDYSSVYGNKNNADTVFLGTSDLTITGTGILQDGTVELAPNAAVVTITFPTALPVGATITAFKAGDATDAGLGTDTVVTFNPARTVATVTFPTIAGLVNLSTPAGRVADSATLNSLTNGVALFVEFTGNNVIPQLSGVTTSSTLAKFATGVNREQNLVCAGSVAGIGGGIRIDVRNYASRAKFPTGNYASYVRLINNSESTSADIFAQMIYADGTYGPYGALPPLAPRAVANYSNAALEALMITTPAAVNPFGATTVYTQTAGATTIGTGSGGSAAAIGDRVRFVSNTGTTLRVQSYILLPNGSLLDTTNAQGVDFENVANNRVPANAVDAQPVSQDAINGLAR